MTIYALVSEISPVILWGLNSRQRLKRQLKEIGKESSSQFGKIHWLNDLGELPENSPVLLINGLFLFDNDTLKAVLEHPESILAYDNELVAAANLGNSNQSRQVLDQMLGKRQDLPAGPGVLETRDLQTFDENLRRSSTALLEYIGEKRKTELENKLYGNAYRGITDLVTKFLWPKPAKRVVHLCAGLGISPNMVTSAGLGLVIAACYLFYEGHYGWGLLAGWLMTFLDTVDGKLARVTVQSSKFGHLFDHGIDLFHPPFWYIYWGMSLTGLQTVAGVHQEQMYWLIIAGYVVGRVVEGVFPFLGDCGIFTWRPFDAWFRLVTARRNPNLILLTLALFISRPDWGFIAVVFWTAFTTIVLVLRLLYAVMVRVSRGPLSSWLGEPDVATGPHARSFSIFGATRGAYAG